MTGLAAVLRRAAVEDADALAPVFTASRRTMTFLPDLHSAAEDRWFIEHEVLANTRVTVALVGDASDAIAGFIGERDGWVDHLYVRPDLRRRGIGRALLTSAKRRQDRFTLWCFEKNRAARAFYKREGLVPIRFTDGAHNMELEPDVLYAWAAPTRIESP